MRKNFLVVSLIVFSSAVFGENVPIWTGVYGGFNDGFVFNNVKLNSNQLGFANISGTCNINKNYSSSIPGVQLGYSHQFDSKMVLGVEGDYTYNTDQNRTLRCSCPFNSDVADQFTFNYKQQASIRGHLGYALENNLLPFLTVGGSFADVGMQYSNEGGDNYSKQTTISGWLVGAGLEWKFLQRWSLRAEYYYTDYGKVNLNIPTVYNLYDQNGGAHAALRTNTLRVALSYWF